MKSRVARLAVFLFILMLQAKDGNPAAFDRNQLQFVPSKVKDTTQMNERDSMDGEQWSCQICTFLNDGDMTKCSMCDTSAPKKTRDDEEKLPEQLRHWNKDIEKSSTHKTRDFDAFNTALFPNDSANTKMRDEETIVSFTPLNLAVGDKASPPGQADRNNDENAGTLTALNRKKIGFNNRTPLNIQATQTKNTHNAGTLTALNRKK
eukprot:1159409_1